MRVTVKLLDQLQRYAKNHSGIFSLEVSQGSSVAHVVERLQIPPTVHRMILINGRRVDEEALLSPGDTVVFLSPMSGGGSQIDMKPSPNNFSEN